MIKHVIFDVMGVIFTIGDDVSGLLIPYIHSLKPDVKVQSIQEAYLSASLGKISSREFWELMGIGQDDIPEVERNYLERHFTLDAGFLPCAKSLKSRYGISLLSNDVSEWSKSLRNHYGIEPLIGAAFISGDLGVRKPEPEIYKMALNALSAKPDECVFIDDTPDRVDGARELGISAILFNRGDHDYNGLRVNSFEQLTKLLL